MHSDSEKLTVIIKRAAHILFICLSAGAAGCSNSAKHTFLDFPERSEARGFSSIYSPALHLTEANCYYRVSNGNRQMEPQMAISKENLVFTIGRIEWTLESDINLVESLTKAQIKERFEWYLSEVSALRKEVMKPRARRSKDEIQKEKQ